MGHIDLNFHTTRLLHTNFGVYKDVASTSLDHLQRSLCRSAGRSQH